MEVRWPRSEGVDFLTHSRGRRLLWVSTDRVFTPEGLNADC